MRTITCDRCEKTVSLVDGSFCGVTLNKIKPGAIFTVCDKIELCVDCQHELIKFMGGRTGVGRRLCSFLALKRKETVESAE